MRKDTHQSRAMVAKNMTMDTIDRTTIDYQNYRFGRSRQRFRGPKPNLSKPYVAFIGGSETYGRFVSEPYPQLVQEQIDLTCANWGTPGAGPSFFLKDPAVLEACSAAQVCVISVMGAVSMSNRLYSVFKRRNARLRSTSEMLEALYPKMDFSEFRFAHNMLHRMYRSNPDNFRVVEMEIQQAWVARMRELMEDIETARVLVWMSTRSPDEGCSPDQRESFVTPPAFVTREMLEKVAPMADMVVEYVPGAEAAAEIAGGGVSDENQVAEPVLRYPGQMMHRQLADILAEPIKNVLDLDAPV